MTPAPRRPRPQRLLPVVPGVLALGSNLGDREATIRAAVVDIGEVPGLAIDAVSHLVETPALKLTGTDPDAPPYLNLVVRVSTMLKPHDLLDALNAIEDRHGRVREERWGDRTLDIDIIDFAGREVADDRLTLPHPRAWQRGFVLVPWFEIEPNATLTGYGRVDELLKQNTDEVRRYPEGEV